MTKVKQNQELIQKHSNNFNGRKIIQSIFSPALASAFFIFLLITIIASCKKNDPQPSLGSATPESNSIDMRQSHSRDFEPVNLIADTAGYRTLRIDHHVNNAWGIAFGPHGTICLASNHTSEALLLDKMGSRLRTPIGIPLQGTPTAGSPTGNVFNNTNNFVIPSSGEKSKFIFASEDGTITAWASGNSAITVADRSESDAVYKGIAIANSNGSNYIYATNFKGSTVDVFDASFNYVSMPFVDPGIPAGFAPFGIQNIGGKLYVSYALQKGPDNEDDQSGPGNGYISIFNADGSFVSRFASQGTLNSPWGIAEVPGGNHAILVGNFGDGRINVFDANGTFLGHLQDDGKTIVIDGLWAIAFAPRDLGCESHRLYFSAGPDGEAHGLFGYIRKE